MEALTCCGGVVLQVWGYVVDGLFCVDIVVSFFTVYMDDLGRAVLNHRRIARHYLRSWFIVDALSTLPVDLLVSIIDPGDTSSVSSLRLLRVLRLARLLKMVRLLKINKLLSGADGLQVRAACPTGAVTDQAWLTRAALYAHATLSLVCRLGRRTC